MEEIVKVCVLGILGVIIALQFKNTKPEYAVYIGIALGILVFGYVIKQLQTMLVSLGSIGKFFEGYGEYLGILMKVIGITYLCEFCAGICKDAGYGSVAQQIEVFGKLSVMFAGLPILLAVVEQIQGYMG